MTTVPDSERREYLRDLRIVVNARSPWLFRDFIQRWGHALGPLGPVLHAKSDEQARELLDEVALVLSGSSPHQLAAQLTAPWLLARSK